ncbi:MAG: hypothetical protein AABZ34_04495 [Nitrospirota bacterium]
MLEAITSFRLRLHGQVRAIERGQAIELDRPDAERLLAKAPDRVRVVEPQPARDITVEPAGPSVRPVYWESGNGRIIGPGQVVQVAKDGTEFWLCIEFGGAVYWIRDFLLRSRQAFDQQIRWICGCCNGSDFWASAYRAHICRRCHPPAAPSLEITEAS